MLQGQTYSPAELSAAMGAPLRAIYKTLSERLPSGGSARSAGYALTRWDAVCLVIDHDLPADIPVDIRRFFYAAILERQSMASVHYARDVLSYVIDVKAVVDRVDEALARYRDAMDLIVEDEAIQGGAPVFRGTRILVQQIAELLSQGADEAELRQDYPRLTPAMLAAAPLYVQAHPRRGRPQTPPWRPSTRTTDLPPRR